MKLFTLSHTNFINVNNNNIIFKDYLRHIWNTEEYYKSTVVKDYAFASGLFQQNVAIQEIIQNKTSVETQESSTVTVRRPTQDVATQVSAPTSVKVENKTNNETQESSTVTVRRRTQDVATQVSAPTSVKLDDHPIPDYPLVVSHKEQQIWNRLKITPGASRSHSSPVSAEVKVPSWLWNPSLTSSPVMSLELPLIPARCPPSIGRLYCWSPVSSNASCAVQLPSIMDLGMSPNPSPNNISVPDRPLCDSQIFAATGTSVLHSKPDFVIQGGQIRTQHASIPVMNAKDIRFQRDLLGNFRVLGEGATGSVFLARLNATGTTVAVKMFKNALEQTPEILYEAMVLSILQDTGFVTKSYGFLQELTDTSKLMLVQECFGNGKTLWSIMNGRDPDVHMTTQHKINIAFQLVFALKAIHDKGVLINDIKSNNVLVDTSTPDFRIRYIDFGMATYESTYTYSNLAAQAFAVMFGGQQFLWLAPEVRMGQQTTPESDIYSVGYLMSELQCAELREVVHLCTQEKAYHRPSLEVVLEMIDFVMSIS